MAGLSRRAFLVLVAWFAPVTRLRAFSGQPATATSISLDEFIELSQRLLGRSKLDRAIAQIYLGALSSDADTAIHLATLAQSSGNPTPEQAVRSSARSSSGGTPASTPSTASGASRRTPARLMWSALGMPAPGHCASAFGAWSRPPGHDA